MSLLLRSNLFFNTLSRSVHSHTKRLLFSTSACLARNGTHNEQLTEVKYKDAFTCVYKFRYINQLRLFSRIKIYQTVLSVASAVGSVVAYDFKLVDDLTALLCLNGAMVFAFVMLFVISRQTVKIVGRIYLNDDQTRVLISHLSFFGKRRDLEIDVADVEPLSTLEELSEKFLKLRLKNSDGHMLISLPMSHVYDKKGFLKIFKIDLKN